MPACSRILRNVLQKKFLRNNSINIINIMWTTKTAIQSLFPQKLYYTI
jgi:hypothetical protein